KKGPARRVVSRGIPPELKENVLDDFFRSRRLLQDAEDQPINNARVAIVEFLECSHVALQKPLRQRRVKRHSARFRGCEDRQKHFEASSSPIRYTAKAAAWMSRSRRLDSI